MFRQIIILNSEILLLDLIQRFDVTTYIGYNITASGLFGAGGMPPVQIRPVYF